MNWNLFSQLQQCEGHLAAALVAVNRDCLGSALTGVPEKEQRISALAGFIPGRAEARELLQAFGKTTWPAAYGQSPYDDVMEVIRCAVAGVALKSGSTPAQRALHGRWLPVYALPAATVRWNLDDDGRRQRYPRLLRAMEHAALLSPGEADSVLRILLRTNPYVRSHSSPSCEAAAHFGGNLKVVRAARLWRSRFASTVKVGRTPRRWAMDTATSSIAQREHAEHHYAQA